MRLTMARCTYVLRHTMPTGRLDGVTCAGRTFLRLKPDRRLSHGLLIAIPCFELGAKGTSFPNGTRVSTLATSLTSLVVYFMTFLSEADTSSGTEATVGNGASSRTTYKQGNSLRSCL